MRPVVVMLCVQIEVNVSMGIEYFRQNVETGLHHVPHSNSSGLPTNRMARNQKALLREWNDSGRVPRR